MRFFCELAPVGKTKEENDKIAIWLWHGIQLAIGINESNLATKPPNYSIQKWGSLKELMVVVRYQDNEKGSYE